MGFLDLLIIEVRSLMRMLESFLVFREGSMERLESNRLSSTGSFYKG